MADTSHLFSQSDCPDIGTGWRYGVGCLWLFSYYFVSHSIPLWRTLEHCMYLLLPLLLFFSAPAGHLICMKEFILDLQIKTNFCKLVLLTMCILRRLERKEESLHIWKDSPWLKENIAFLLHRDMHCVHYFCCTQKYCHRKYYHRKFLQLTLRVSCPSLNGGSSVLCITFAFGT